MFGSLPVDDTLFLRCVISASSCVSSITFGSEELLLFISAQSLRNVFIFNFLFPAAWESTSFFLLQCLDTSTKRDHVCIFHTGNGNHINMRPCIILMYLESYKIDNLVGHVRPSIGEFLNNQLPFSNNLRITSRFGRALLWKQQRINITNHTTPVLCTPLALEHGVPSPDYHSSSCRCNYIQGPDATNTVRQKRDWQSLFSVHVWQYLCLSSFTRERRLPIVWLSITSSLPEAT